jgi:hypothetical protein
MGGEQWMRVYQGKGEACTIKPLRGGCMYVVRVRACNAAGWGQFCAPFAFATSADVPDAPDPPKLTVAGAVGEEGGGGTMGVMPCCPLEWLALILTFTPRCLHTCAEAQLIVSGVVASWLQRRRRGVRVQGAVRVACVVRMWRLLRRIAGAGPLRRSAERQQL